MIKHNNEKFITIGRILMFYWFAFLMHKQGNNLRGNGLVGQIEFYMM